ncbi:MAG: hypothetical protein PHV97_02860 [Candidatus Omnitrophica bacterium]|nr:hypothetical protein [Candidatus Omnitrophota bacterium]
MFLRFVSACCFSVAIIFCSTSAFAGKVELTTYYPAPYGEYKQLKATGADTDNGTLALEAKGSSGTGLVVTNANNVGIGTTNPQGILDLTSTEAAFFPPRVTTAQRNALVSIAEGAVVYNTDTNALDSYNGTSWCTTQQGLIAYRGHDTGTRCPGNSGTFTGNQVCSDAGKTCAATVGTDNHWCNHAYDCGNYGGPANTGGPPVVIFCE